MDYLLSQKIDLIECLLQNWENFPVTVPANLLQLRLQALIKKMIVININNLIRIDQCSVNLTLSFHL